MKSGYEAGLWSAIILVLFADAAAAVATGFVLLEFRTARAGGVTVAFLLLALPLACAFVAIVALTGFYRAPLWFQARRLAERAIVAVAILVIALVSGAAAGIWPMRRPDPSFAVVALLYMSFVFSLRMVVAAGLRGTVVPALPGAVRSPEVAGVGGGGVVRAAQRMDEREAKVALHPTTALPTDGGTRSPRSRAASAASPIGRVGFGGVDRSDDPMLWQRSRGQVDLETLPADWLDRAAIAEAGPVSRICRRAFDIVGSLALIVVVLPVLLLTALAIRIESRGPVFYRQERVGRNGRVFTLYKFRSMTVDAERDGPRWAVPQDPRVTGVGRLIRLTRIDEIPQVINVLRGEMALIGPRPERPGFVDQLAAIIPHYADRAAVKPGITGWAQVNYPYGASVEDARNKLAYDLYYIQHRSLAMDASIVMGTLRVIILQEGAR